MVSVPASSTVPVDNTDKLLCAAQDTEILATRHKTRALVWASGFAAMAVSAAFHEWFAELLIFCLMLVVLGHFHIPAPKDGERRGGKAP